MGKILKTRFSNKKLACVRSDRIRLCLSNKLGITFFYPNSFQLFQSFFCGQRKHFLMESLGQTRLKSIFYLAISSSGKFLYKGRPLVPVYTEEFDQLHIIFCCPLVSTDIGVKSFIPTFTALLSNSSRKTVGYLHPITRAYIFDPLHKNLVFFLTPTAMSNYMTIVV